MIRWRYHWSHISTFLEHPSPDLPGSQGYLGQCLSNENYSCRASHGWFVLQHNKVHTTPTQSCGFRKAKLLKQLLSDPPAPTSLFFLSTLAFQLKCHLFFIKGRFFFTGIQFWNWKLTSKCLRPYSLLQMSGCQKSTCLKSRTKNNVCPTFWRKSLVFPYEASLNSTRPSVRKRTGVLAIAGRPSSWGDSGWNIKLL